MSPLTVRPFQDASSAMMLRTRSRSCSTVICAHNAQGITGPRDTLTLRGFN